MTVGERERRRKSESGVHLCRVATERKIGDTFISWLCVAERFGRENGKDDFPFDFAKLWICDLIVQ